MMLMIISFLASLAFDDADKAFGSFFFSITFGVLTAITNKP
jgi:hypothetical protein